MQTWGRIPVHDTPMASCGALASQTHNSVVASSAHEFYHKDTGQNWLGSRARVEDMIEVSVSELQNQRNWFHIFRSSR
jgi:hypothetical protein